MFSNTIISEALKGLKIKKYPTADKNAHLLRLLSQGIPYLFFNNGFSFSPLSVFIHVNTNCNLKCKMCDAGQEEKESMFYQNLKGGDSKDMPIDSFKTIIDKVKPFKPFVGIPALEPLLYPDIIEAVSYINRQGLRSSVATNGTLLADLADGLIRAGLAKIVVSLDGPPEAHDKIRGVSGTYDKVAAGITELYELKMKFKKSEPKVYINYVISEDNYDKIIKFVKGFPLEMVEQVDFRVMFYCTGELAKKHNEQFGKKYDATSACLSGGINLDRVDTDMLYEQIMEVTSGYRKKCRFFFDHGKRELYSYYHLPEVFLDDTRCVFPWYTIQVDQSGNAIPPQRCYHQIFGNVLEQGFNEVWNGKKYKDFRKDLRKFGRFPACTRCEGVNF